MEQAFQSGWKIHIFINIPWLKSERGKPGTTSTSQHGKNPNSKSQLGEQGICDSRNFWNDDFKSVSSALIFKGNKTFLLARNILYFVGMTIQRNSNLPQQSWEGSMEQKSLSSWNNKIQLGQSQGFYLQIQGGGGGDQEHTPAESNDLLDMAGNQTVSAYGQAIIQELERKVGTWTGIRLCFLPSGSLLSCQLLV